VTGDAAAVVPVVSSTVVVVETVAVVSVEDGATVVAVSPDVLGEALGVVVLVWAGAVVVVVSIPDRITTLSAALVFVTQSCHMASFLLPRRVDTISDFTSSTVDCLAGVIDSPWMM